MNHLSIRQVGNGYIVETGHIERVYEDKEKIKVFQSYAELEIFLSNYFTYRATNIEPDK